MNKEQYEFSQEAIARMIERLEERCGNAIANISLIDFDSATQADYINGIDAIMVDCGGFTHKLQFKSRINSNDVCIELAVAPRMTYVSYYSDKYDKHLMVNPKATDIFIQELADGTTFIYTSFQLFLLMQYELFWSSPIYRNKEGEYLLFIPKDDFEILIKQMYLDIAM